MILFTSKLLTQVYRYHKLQKTFGKFIWSYSELLCKFGAIPFQEYVSKGITHPVFYGDFVYKLRRVKAILQVLIYKALYDKSYMGSQTTMTSGEWTCLISFATAPLTCSERRGSEKFKMKIYVSSGIRTHHPPVHYRKVAAP